MKAAQSYCRRPLSSSVDEKKEYWHAINIATRNDLCKATDQTSKAKEIHLCPRRWQAYGRKRNIAMDTFNENQKKMHFLDIFTNELRSCHAPEIWDSFGEKTRANWKYFEAMSSSIPSKHSNLLNDDWEWQWLCVKEDKPSHSELYTRSIRLKHRLVVCSLLCVFLKIKYTAFFAYFYAKWQIFYVII